MKRSLFPIALTACALTASSALCQEFRATLTGRVADALGAVIPSSQITVINQETGVKTPSITNNSGDYTVPFLQPGKYSFAVVARGFSTYTRNDVTATASPSTSRSPSALRRPKSLSQLTPRCSRPRPPLPVRF